MSAIEVRDVRKRFRSVQALDGVDLDISEGEFFALLGPNGAGKTTLINTLAGLCLADSGTLKVKGFDVVADYRRARRALGVVPQELVFDPFFDVREALAIQSGYFGLRRNDAWIDEIIARLGLTQKAHTNMRALSGGMKRRVLVALALVHKPPVIVLDEPTAGVDVELRQGLWDFMRVLNRDGHTIVLTTHYLEEAETLCSRIAMMKEGRIVALDTTANLLRSVPGRSLRLRIEPDRLPSALEAMRPGRDGKVWTVELHDFAQVGPIMDALRGAGIAVQDMEVAVPDLEDVFVRIMSR
ncbi:MAG: ABC transporter ATP-binding protein [Burkholderiales bacterium]|nr:ABC transporter ATP-binding protein [Burkholderiales bacterium]